MTKGTRSDSKSCCYKFCSSTLFQKMVVAVTGLMMVGWLVGHLLGNLQIFAGRGVDIEHTKINQYAAFLHQNVALLWAVRFIMLGAIGAHILTTFKLTRANKEARPQDYYVKTPVGASAASRMMIFGGLFILFYLIFHLLHFTFNVAYPSTHQEGDLYQSFIHSFQNPVLVIIYVLGQVALFFHLFHGFQSAGRTLGVPSRYVHAIEKIGYAVSIFITTGFSSIPVSILLGIIS